MISALLAAAEDARARGALDEAEACAQQALAQAAHDPRAQVLAGTLCHLRGDLDGACGRYRRALAHEGRHGPAHYALAVSLALRGQPRLARQHLARALDGEATPGLSGDLRLRAQAQDRELALLCSGAARAAFELAAAPLFRLDAPGAPPLAAARPGLTAVTVERVAALLQGATRAVALTGAGLSAASGLITRKQLWTRHHRDEAVSIWRFRAQPLALWRAIDDFWTPGEHPPNAAHEALAALAAQGRLQGVVTQNVDGLHQAAFARAGRDVPVVELHGTLLKVRCAGCGRADPRTAPAIVRSGAALPPACAGCGGVLRPEVVLFGERVEREALERARALVERADVLLVLGCAMDVSPAAELPHRAARHGAAVVEFKRRPSRLARSLGVLHLPGPVEATLPEVLRRLT
jgi:NAD-dependent deacetylase